jgi:hypothetical protein
MRIIHVWICNLCIYKYIYIHIYIYTFIFTHKIICIFIESCGHRAFQLTDMPRWSPQFFLDKPCPSGLGRGFQPAQIRKAQQKLQEKSALKQSEKDVMNYIIYNLYTWFVGLQPLEPSVHWILMRNGFSPPFWMVFWASNFEACLD